ncbi:MAG TPA: hypothetical protein VNT79_03805 [Phycisphaerae bacterium]|nr:hypothetical protein [Phycisphaerae bacterium]
MTILRLPLFTILCLGLFVRAANAQPAPIDEVIQTLSPAVDSNSIAATSSDDPVAFSAEITVPGVQWIRIQFDVAELPGRFGSAASAKVVLTSLLDGATQTLDRRSMKQWKNTSAYFNGDAVFVELIAPISAGTARIRIERLWTSAESAMPRNTCGPTDDRIASSDARAGRALPIGCTAWLIRDANRCLLSAGHCAAADGANLQVIEFNVPPSTGSGTMVHPPPEDQFAVDLDSLQTHDGGTAIGNDWAYFGCFENGNTGLTAFESQSDAFYLAAAPPVADNRIIRKTGFGTVDPPVSPTLHLAQKTLAGPLTVADGTMIRYPIDSSGGDSGSPVFEETTQQAIAIHTNGGCPSTGVNSGCSIHHPGLQDALANPQGVCIPNYVDFAYPDGRPEPLHPLGGTVLRVSITGRNGYIPAAAGNFLHVDSGGGFTAVALTQVAGGEYEGEFPPAPCGTLVNYYLSCDTVDGHTGFDPREAPEQFYSAIVGTSLTPILSFDFETPGNWGVSNISVTSGGWERGIPAGDGSRGDPELDYDGSGQCFTTGLAGGDHDLDGGPTRLFSPPFALTNAVDPYIRYARWFTNDDQDIDRLTVELSDNFGSSWTVVESVPFSEGWTMRTVRVRDYFPPTNGVRLRFSASDQPNDSTTEAAIDAVSVFDLQCEVVVPCLNGDVNTDESVDGQDIQAFVGVFLVPPPPDSPAFCAADMDENAILEIDEDLPLFIDALIE